MQKNSGDFSMQDALRLINSPAGQQLLALLQKSDDAALKKAMALAANGQLDLAKESLRDIAASAEVQKILGKDGG